jgi:putative component of membrane protein insertase Oxa1/YidC/SpoIIIJ protein YidD
MRFGIVKGLLLGLSRLIRCNGWFFRGGGDGVPQEFTWAAFTAPYSKFRR